MALTEMQEWATHIVRVTCLNHGDTFETDGRPVADLIDWIRYDHDLSCVFRSMTSAAMGVIPNEVA
jgi:hypothetical protein